MSLFHLSRQEQMRRFNQFLPERMIEEVHSISESTQVSQSEVIRRMLDYCFREEVLNEVFPVQSGQLLNRRK